MCGVQNRKKTLTKKKQTNCESLHKTFTLGKKTALTMISQKHKNVLSELMCGREKNKLQSVQMKPCSWKSLDMFVLVTLWQTYPVWLYPAKPVPIPECSAALLFSPPPACADEGHTGRISLMNYQRFTWISISPMDIFPFPFPLPFLSSSSSFSLSPARFQNRKCSKSAANHQRCSPAVTHGHK